MTQKQLQDYGSAMMEKHPNQKDLIFIAVDDSFEYEDENEMLQKFYDWITDICEKDVIVEPDTIVVC